MRTKMRGPDSLELDVEMRKKKETLTNGYFFEHLLLAYTAIELMNDLVLVR